MHIDHAKNIFTGQIFDFCLLFLAFLNTSYVLSRTQLIDWLSKIKLLA